MTDGNGGWQLKSVEVRGFLGADEDGVEVDLDRPVVVLTGPNGSGKSTLLTAVEWALFGRAPFAPGPVAHFTGAGSRTAAEVAFINRNCDGCSVTLRFTRDGSELTWTRERTRSAPTDEDDVVSVELDGEPAPQDPAVHFGLDHDVFRRSVAPRQGALTALVLDEDGDRDDALSRLLGVDRLDAAVNGLARAARHFGNELDTLGEGLAGVIAPLRDRAVRAFDRRAEARQRAIDDDVPVDHLNLDGARRIVESITDAIGDPVTASITGHEDLADVVEDLDQKANKAFTDAAPHRRGQRLNGLKEQLSGLREGWQRALDDRDTASTKLAELVDEHGSVDDVRDALEAATDAKEQADAALAEANERAAILNRTNEWLEHQHDEDEVDCPACERDIPTDDLRNIVAGGLEAISGEGGQVAELQRKIEEVTERSKSIAKTLKTLEKQSKRADDAKTKADQRYTELVHGVSSAHQELIERSDRDEVEDRIKEALDELTEALPEPTDEGPEIDAEAVDGHLRSFLQDSLQAAIEKTKAQIGAADQRIKRVRSQIVKVRSIAEVVDASAQLSALDELLTTDEIARAHAALSEARGEHEVLERLHDLAERIADSETESIVQAIGPEVDRWFGELSRHDALTRVKIDGAVSRNSIRYQVRATNDDGSWTAAPGPEISGGYQTVLSISVLLALSEQQVEESSLSLLALDEIHGLDPDAQERLLAVLGSKSPADRTIVTMTDTEDARPLIDAAGEARTRVIEFEPWTDEHGIRVRS